MTRRAFRVLVVIVATFAPRGASAQSAADKAAAEVLFDEGKALMQDKEYPLACAKLHESNRLDAGLGTVLWLADCYEKNGQSASAWAEFREAADVAARDHDPRERVARERADRLQPTLSKLTILAGPLSGVPGLVVKRDADEVGKGQWGVGVPVDPGPHTVTVTAPHKRVWTSSVFVPAGVNVDVAMPTALVAAVEPVDAAAVAPPVRPRRMKPEEPAGSSDGGTQRAAGGVLIGLGVAGVAAGSVLGVLAIVANQDSMNTCGGRCASEAAQDAVQGHSETIGSIASLAGGGALLLTGIIVVLTAPSTKPHARERTDTAARVNVAPWRVGSAWGLGVGGAFE
jgi:hypothetical protein